MRHDPERAAAAYLAGELGPRQRERFEAHVLGCDDCWREVTAGRQGRALAESLREVAPQHLRERIRATIAAAPAGRRRRIRLGTRMPALMGVVAALVAVAVAGGLLALRAPAPAQPVAITAAVASYRAGVAAWTPTGEPPPARELGGLTWQGATRGELVGQPVPRVELPDLEASSRQVRLADLVGRPAVVNFWASWCPFCAAEMPAFERVPQRLGERVAFVGIDQRDQRGPALALARRTGVSYRLAFDPAGRSFDAFGGLGMPTTVLLRADGTVAEIVTGQLDEQALARKLHDDLGVTINPGAGGTAAPAPLVDPARIIPGGPPPDGIPPLDHPRFQPAGSVAWLAPAEPVAAVQVAGRPRRTRCRSWPGTRSSTTPSAACRSRSPTARCATPPSPGAARWWTAP